LPNDWTPFDNAKKQISQATAKATAKWVTIPSRLSIPLLISNTRRLQVSPWEIQLIEKNKNFLTKNTLHSANSSYLNKSNINIIFFK